METAEARAVVASGNTTTSSPAASAAATRAFTRAASRTLSRTMKSASNRRAIVPAMGQEAVSILATKRAGHQAPSAYTSSQET
jgi:hypothetical protein